MKELKAINAHGVHKDDGAYYDRRQVDKYIDELDERHTTEITALEVSYRLQLDGLRYDKDAEIRRLKRALWLARSYRGRDNSILLTSKFMRNVWDNVERKCLKKAKQYK